MARIIGNTTATPMPVPDWNQTDERKADYIKNKPNIPSNIGDRLAEIEAQIGDILYEAISITSFKSSVSSAEMGSTVTDVTLSWEINKTPTSLSLGSEALDVNDKSKTLTGLSIKSNNTWTLKATDERGAISTKEAKLTFYNGVYFGVTTQPSVYNDAFILGLSKALRSTKLPSFTVDAGAEQYIYYCVPSRFGECKFNVGGFDGGFAKIATFDFTNASGYTESYDIYKSDNANLGSTTVSVS